MNNPITEYKRMFRVVGGEYPEYIWFVPAPDFIHMAGKDNYEYIKSIHPIPLKPKLLEVGTKVRIIGGVDKGFIGVITNYEDDDYRIESSDGNCSFTTSMYHVVPEPLLVEEDENKEAKAILGEFQYNALIQAGYKVIK